MHLAVRGYFSIGCGGRRHRDRGQSGGTAGPQTFKSCAAEFGWRGDALRASWQAQQQGRATTERRVPRRTQSQNRTSVGRVRRRAPGNGGTARPAPRCDGCNGD